MAPINESRENIGQSYMSNPQYQSDYRTYEFIEGQNRRVYVDNDNRDFVFIEGKRVYLDEYAILQMKQKVTEDMKASQERLLASYKELENARIAEKEEYEAKQQAAVAMYNTYNEAKHTAQKKYDETLSQADCSSLAQLEDYQKMNGGNWLETALGFLKDRSKARSGEIRSESDISFYGWMCADAAKSANNFAQMEIIARKSLPSIFMD